MRSDNLRASTFRVSSLYRRGRVLLAPPHSGWTQHCNALTWPPDGGTSKTRPLHKFSVGAKSCLCPHTAARYTIATPRLGTQMGTRATSYAKPTAVKRLGPYIRQNEKAKPPSAQSPPTHSVSNPIVFRSSEIQASGGYCPSISIASKSNETPPPLRQCGHVAVDGINRAR